MHTAPYIIVGFHVPLGTPDEAAILSDITTKIPLAATFVSLNVPHVGALKVTTANMHDRLDDVADFMVGMNAAHGGVIAWFAQLCEDAFLASEP